MQQSQTILYVFIKCTVLHQIFFFYSWLFLFLIFKRISNLKFLSAVILNDIIQFMHRKLFELFSEILLAKYNGIISKHRFFFVYLKFEPYLL